MRGDQTPVCVQAGDGGQARELPSLWVPIQQVPA